MLNQKCSNEFYAYFFVLMQTVDLLELGLELYRDYGWQIIGFQLPPNADFLKFNSGVTIVDDGIRDNTAMNVVSYFSTIFSFSS